MDTSNLCPHHGKRFHNPLHGPPADGFIPCQGYIEILGCQDSADQPCRGAAVAAVQDLFRGGKPAQPPAVNQDSFPLILNRNSHLCKTGNGGEAVCPLKKTTHLGKAFGNRAEHDTAV